jgi:catechol-2,3-dioxygenase
MLPVTQALEIKIIGEEMPKLDHIALEVSNLDRAIKFYTEKLGFFLKSRSTNKEKP